MVASLKISPQKRIAFALAVAATSVGIATAPANAWTITANGQNYQIDIWHGSYDENPQMLESNPWWGDPQLAHDLAQQFHAWFGNVNSSSAWNAGPAVAFAHVDPENLVSSWMYGTYSGVWEMNAILYPEAKVPWNHAIALPVPPENGAAIPTPALLPGLLGMGAAAWRKRRLASSAGAE